MSSNFKTRNNTFGVNIESLVNDTLSAGTANINADNVSIQGVNLSTKITGIMNEIDADNLLQLNTPSLTGTNPFTGNNSFSILPTSSVLATSNTQLTNKQYTDTAISNNITALKSYANNWTSTNTFNTNLPTSTLNPTSNTQLTTKSYVDNSINSLKTSANIWTAKQTINKDLIINTSHAGNYYDTSGNHIPPLVISDFDTNQNKYANISFVINGTDGLSNIISSNNNINTSTLKLFTYSSSTNGLTVNNNSSKFEGGSNYLTVGANDIIMNINPKINSYILPSNNNELTPKKYVDDTFTNFKNNENIFLQKQTISAGGLIPLEIKNNTSNKGISFISDGSLGNYNPIFSNNCSGVIATGSMDNSSLILCPHSSTSSGIGLYGNNIIIGSGGNANIPTSNIKIDGNSNTIEFSKIPKITTELTSQIIDDKHLTTKKFVDDKFNTISLGLSNVENTADIDKVMSNQTRTYVDNAILSSSNISGQLIKYSNNAYLSNLPSDTNPYYVLNYPFMGGLNQSNSAGHTPKNVFIQTNQEPIVSGWNYQEVELDIIYFINRNQKHGSNSTFVEGTAVRKNTPFTTGEFAGSTSGFPVIHKASVNLSNSGSGFSAKISFASLNLFNTYSIQTGNTVSTLTNNLTATCIPLTFTADPLQSGQTQRQKISINYPNFYNNPLCFGGGINSYGFSIQITKGFDPIGNNGWYLSEI